MAIVERQVLPALLLAGLATACVLAVVYFDGQYGAVVLREDSKTERAVENSFFDSLAAKDHAKGVVLSSSAKNSRSISAAQERDVDNQFFAKLARQQHTAKGKRIAVQHNAARPVMAKASADASKKGAAAKPVQKQAATVVPKHHRESMDRAFAKAKEELAKEKRKMRHMEEQDKVKESEQKTEIERMSAHHQADEYVRHLEKLNSEVFPTSMEALVGRKHSTTYVKNALVDDMSTKPATKLATKVHAKAHVPKKAASHKPVAK
mmetsp:Transcript_23339/g.47181  ORF Transcript_23339/g.47181 Transcript_23339/m.47181 type:complete len:264 (-) Transcript_23339:60-851(-)